MSRLVNNWVYGGALAGVLFLLLAPVIDMNWSVVVVLIYLQLPIYMLHQYKEHDADRFRRTVNDLIGHGKNVLPSSAIFVVNIGVWFLCLVSFWLGYRVAIGWGLIGVYLLLVNAVVHIAQAIRLRSYNPGLVTAIVLFLPLGFAGLWAIGATGEATVLQHVVSLGLAIIIHVGIVVYVLGNVRRLSSLKAA